MRSEIDALKVALNSYKSATRTAIENIQNKVVTLTNQLGTDYSPDIVQITNEILADTTVMLEFAATTNVNA